MVCGQSSASTLPRSDRLLFFFQYEAVNAVTLFTDFKQKSEIHFTTCSLTRSIHHREFCINLQAWFNSRGNTSDVKVFLPYTVEDSLHNASLDFYTFHLYFKKYLNSGSHYICNINAITLLAGLWEITVYIQNLLHVLCGFLSKGRLWLYRKTGLCLNIKFPFIFLRVQTIRD